VRWAEFVHHLLDIPGESLGDGALGRHSLGWGCHWSCSTCCIKSPWVKTLSIQGQASAAPLATLSSLEVSLLEIALSGGVCVPPMVGEGGEEVGS
jgi:hypothetical protein